MISEKDFFHKRTGRRSFLTTSAKLGAAAVGLLTVGCESKSRQTLSSPTPTTVNKTEIATPKSGLRNFGGVEIEINDLGLPFKYSLPDGRIGTFDLEQMEFYRSKAIANQEVEFAAHIPYEGQSFKEIYKETPEKPRTLDLPKDVMSEAELSDKGVEIIQAGTKLYIRRQAFDKDGPLAAFDGIGRKLIIVAVDGPYIDSSFIQDPKYDRVRHIYGGKQEFDIHNIEKFKTIVLPRYYEELESAREQVAAAKKIGDSTQDAEFQIRFNKEWIYLLENARTAHDMDDYAGLYPAAQTMGQYFGPERSGIPDTAVIFFAKGKNNSTLNHFFMTFEKDGQIWGQVQKSHGGTDRRPRPEETHPNPEEYFRGDGSPSNPMGYAFTGVGPGRELEHEIMHDKYNRKDPTDQNEYFTDKDAVDEMERGFKRWRQSGFMDDSGYYFVWELDQELGGGYILTSTAPTNAVSNKA